MEGRMSRPTDMSGWFKAILPWLLLLALLLLPVAGLSANLMRLLFITAVWTTTSLGWNLPSAVGISDAGHIVGSGSHNSATRQWMMYPTPQE